MNSGGRRSQTGMLAIVTGEVHMGDNLYHTLRLLAAPFRYRCLGLQNIRDHGPAIYIANHLGAVGPIQVVLSVPVRFHPWILGETADPERGPEYIYHDFVEPALRLHGRLGVAVARLCSRAAVGLTNGLGCVVMDSNRGRYMGAFRHSLALLSTGKSLLIFPEAAQGPFDPETRMRPFLFGFLLLCSLYEELTGSPLPVYPMAVSRRRRTVTIGEPAFLRSQGRRRDDIHRLGGELETRVRRLYIDSIGPSALTRDG